jgi:ABC-type Fe3+-hydroxamate transport system substrate-binding protein
VSGDATARSRARRIVSLVPSLTEALFALGLGERVVGVTDWCVHPAARVARVPKVGGTKNPSLERIAELRPDLVIANREENRRRDVERLRERGIDVWVTYPRTVADAVELLAELADLGAPRDARQRVLEPIQRAHERAHGAARRRAGAATRVFCPIWKEPWMAVGGDTYADDLLRLCGGENVFGDRSERRYPIVREEEIVAAAPEVILLPDEPYAFGPRDVAELCELPLPAARSRRIHVLDGTLVSWYGPRIGRAIQTLEGLLEPVAPAGS